MGKHIPENKKAYSREYYSRPGPRAERAAYQRRRYYSEAEREKRDARQATKNAIRRGDLIPQPCEKCGEVKVDAHHDDYSKPLVVRWLCRPHHSEHHKAAQVSNKSAKEPNSGNGAFGVCCDWNSSEIAKGEVPVMIRDQERLLNAAKAVMLLVPVKQMRYGKYIAVHNESKEAIEALEKLRQTVNEIDLSR